jgi:hypothetical protein
MVYNTLPRDSLPQTIAAFYAILADLILLFCAEASCRGILTREDVTKQTRLAFKPQRSPTSSTENK